MCDLNIAISKILSFFKDHNIYCWIQTAAGLIWPQLSSFPTRTSLLTNAIKVVDIRLSRIWQLVVCEEHIRVCLLCNCFHCFVQRTRKSMHDGTLQNSKFFFQNNFNDLGCSTFAIKRYPRLWNKSTFRFFCFFAVWCSSSRYFLKLGGLRLLTKPFHQLSYCTIA